MIETLELGRDAAKRHAWIEAVEALTSADAAAPLDPDDLETLADALWWAGRPDDSIEAYERAFGAAQAAGRHEQAAGIAMQLAYQQFRTNNIPVASGWVGQAAELLGGLPEGPMHAWIGVFGILNSFVGGDIVAGLAAADETMELARRTGNPSALYQAMSFKGYGALTTGRFQEGMQLIDAAAAAAASGQLDLRAASDIFCNTIASCRNVGDLGRAAQWADEGERWMRRNGSAGYPGICRIHRAELKKLRGDWAGAETEARQACEELQRFRLQDAVGFGQYEIGEIRLRMGDLDGAAEAFDRAYELGHDAMPGLAILQLARGEVEGANRSINRALAAASGTGDTPDRLIRARLLPTKVEAALAAGDLEAAGAAVEELETIATDVGRPYFKAGALTARGELLLGEQRAAEASPILGQSWRLWQTSDIPYESARARLHYAEALAAEGDTATSRKDLLGARTVFDRLGAALDVQRVDALLSAGGDDAGAAGPGAGVAGAAARPEDRVTRTFMFTDIVTSTDLLEAVGDEAWMELLGWHDRTLRAAFVEHRGDEVSHTGDGFFVAFEKPADGIACAVDIQRRLARHRREHGFSPGVRIGLHAAEATKRGRNFAGQGVHVAARVAGAAGREEIFVSASTVAAAGRLPYPLGAPRAVELKGIKEPVEVQTVDWR